MTDYAEQIRKKYLDKYSPDAVRKRYAPRTRGADKSKELDQRVSDLEHLAAETGAGTPEVDKPGLARRVIDILSRPNYAMAGLAEEALTERGAATEETPLGRAARELFSGIGNLKGEKEDFGQVLEQSGVDTYTLANAFPQLEGSWVGELGTRGAAGLALDILTDPTTYITLGSNSFAKVTLKSGAKYLSKAGQQLRGELIEQAERKYAPMIRGALDDSDRAIIRGKMNDEWRDQLEKQLIGSDGKVLRPELVSDDGLKWMGANILPKSVAAELGESTVNALRGIPGAGIAIDRGVQFGQATKKALNGLFSPFGPLANAPAVFRDKMIELGRNFTAAKTFHSGRLLREVAELDEVYRKLEKIDPNIGQKLYRVRAGKIALTDLSPEELDLFNRVDDIYRTTQDTAIKYKVLDEPFPDYWHQSYLNSEEIGASKIENRVTPLRGEARFTLHRPYADFDEAIERTTELHKVSIERARKDPNTIIEPIAKPNYDVIRNLTEYVNQYSDKLARQLYYDEAKRIFGRALPDTYKPGQVYDLATPLANPQYAARHRPWLNAHRNIFKEGHGSDATWARAVAEADNLLHGASTDEKLEFFARAFQEVDDLNGAYRIKYNFKKYDQFFPEVHASLPQYDEASRLYWGVDAKLSNVSGGMWGPKAISIPAIVKETVENLNGRALDKGVMKEIRPILDGYDFLNNWFKIGTYMGWPSSAFRDGYSNVFQSFLDIGIGAFAHPGDTFNVLRGQGRVTLGGRTYTGKELRDMSQEIGVVDKAGRSYIQMTGEHGEKVARAGKLSKAIAARASIDNMSRVQLWLNHMRRGADPMAARDSVYRVLFNYGELSQVERDIFRRIMPFYTYPRKAIEFHAKELAKHPGRIATSVKPFRGRDDENEAMVKWEKEGLKIRLDRDGKTVRMLTGVDLPIRTLDTIWSGSKASTMRRVLGMVTPTLKTPMEIGFGQNLFTGQPLTAVQAPALGRAIEFMDDLDALPQSMKNWIGYTKSYDSAGRPRYTVRGDNELYLFLKSWAFSRMVTTSDRMFREYLKDDAVGASMLDFLTGIRAKEMDLDEQKKRVLEERIRALEEQQIKRGTHRRGSYIAPVKGAEL